MVADEQRPVALERRGKLSGNHGRGWTLHQLRRSEAVMAGAKRTAS
jgi:hypothetical protein